jgi:hypothetical protein
MCFESAYIVVLWLRFRHGYLLERIVDLAWLAFDVFDHNG